MKLREFATIAMILAWAWIAWVTYEATQYCKDHPKDISCQTK